MNSMLSKLECNGPEYLYTGIQVNEFTIDIGQKRTFRTKREEYRAATDEWFNESTTGSN